MTMKSYTSEHSPAIKAHEENASLAITSIRNLALGLPETVAEVRAVLESFELQITFALGMIDTVEANTAEVSS